jgi:hypothetical protein
MLRESNRFTKYDNFILEKALNIVQDVIMTEVIGETLDHLSEYIKTNRAYRDYPDRLKFVLFTLERSSLSTRERTLLIELGKMTIEERINCLSLLNMLNKMPTRSVHEEIEYIIQKNHDQLSNRAVGEYEKYIIHTVAKSFVESVITLSFSPSSLNELSKDRAMNSNEIIYGIKNVYHFNPYLEAFVEKFVKSIIQQACQQI